MKELVVLNLGRNRIKKLLDESEKKQAKKILAENNREPKPLMDCFSKKLRILDLSSNMLREFPKDLNVLNLEELNLMNNYIEKIPTSFYMSKHLPRGLKRLLLNQNELTELNPMIDKLEKLEVLGIAMTKIQKLPAQISKIITLREIYVSGTPLKQPKLALAMRGINAIREFFQQNGQDDDDEETKAAKDGGDDDE